MDHPTAIQPFNTGGMYAPGAPPGNDISATTEYPSISLDTEMLDEDEIMAMNTVDDGARSGSTLHAYDNTASISAENAPEELVTHKVHLRGLDNMSSADVKGYVGSFFPIPEVEKLEWIDDTSLNLVYKDEETAFAALNALSENGGAGIPGWEFREAGRAEGWPLARLDTRVAFVTDRKEKGARERSRYYLFHPEEDKVEAEDRRRREQGGPRRGGRMRREGSEYRERDYSDRRYRSRSQDGGRNYDSGDDRRRDRLTMDDSNNSVRREPIELFPNGVSGKAGRSSRTRSRSRSRSPIELFPEKVMKATIELFPEKVNSKPVELFPDRVGRTPVELFPERDSGKATKLFSERVTSKSIELFPDKVNKTSVELFPERVGGGRRRSRSPSEYRLATPPRTLFSANDPIEPPRRGQSPPIQRRERDAPRGTDSRMELFPEKVHTKSRISDGPRSLGNRIDGGRSNSSRRMDTSMDSADDLGMSIRGSAGSVNIRGAAHNAGVELLPGKASNSLFDRVGEAPGRRGARRQKAEDMFG